MGYFFPLKLEVKYFGGFSNDFKQLSEVARTQVKIEIEFLPCSCLWNF